MPLTLKSSCGLIAGVVGEDISAGGAVGHALALTSRAQTHLFELVVDFAGKGAGVGHLQLHQTRMHAFLIQLTIATPLPICSQKIKS